MTKLHQQGRYSTYSEVSTLERAQCGVRRRRSSSAGSALSVCISVDSDCDVEQCNDFLLSLGGQDATTASGTGGGMQVTLAGLRGVILASSFGENARVRTREPPPCSHTSSSLFAELGDSLFSSPLDGLRPSYSAEASLEPWRTRL